MLTLNQVLHAVRLKPQIPAPTETVSRILTLTKNHDTDLRKVAELIARDPGLTSQLLRQANSSLYAAARPTSSVSAACVRLGLKRVRAAVINQHVVSGLGKACPPGYDAKQFWQAALATSVAAADLATQLLPACTEDAGTAGLLCDIGIGMMAYAIPNEYAAVLRELKNEGLHRLDAIEQRHIGVTHAQVARAILGDWKIEPRLIEAVARHHDLIDSAPATPAREAPDPFCRIVGMATTLAGIAIEGSDMNLVERLFSQAAAIAPDAEKLVDRLLDKLVEHIQRAAENLNVELGSTDQMKENISALMVTTPAKN